MALFLGQLTLNHFALANHVKYTIFIVLLYDNRMGLAQFVRDRFSEVEYEFLLSEPFVDVES